MNICHELFIKKDKSNMSQFVPDNVLKVAANTLPHNIKSGSFVE